MSDVGKKIVKGLKEAASGKPLMVTVYCPNCALGRRAKMSPLRIFERQKCKYCQYVWTPPRAKRKD